MVQDPDPDFSITMETKYMEDKKEVLDGLQGLSECQNYLFLLPIFPPSSHSSQETKETSTPTRPVENVALTTKGLQERKHNTEWDDGGKISNKNKVIQ